MIGITWSSAGTPYWSFGPTSEAAFGSVTSALCEGMLRAATLLKQHEAAFGSSTIRKVTAMARGHFGWRCGFVVAFTYGWLAAHPPVVLAGEITPFSSDSAEADGLQSLASQVGAVAVARATPSLAAPVAPSVVSATTLRQVLAIPTYQPVVALSSALASTTAAKTTATATTATAATPAKSTTTTSIASVAKATAAVAGSTPAVSSAAGSSVVAVVAKPSTPLGTRRWV